MKKLKFTWVILPPLVFSLVTFCYFFRFYTPNEDRISLIKNTGAFPDSSKGPSYDPLEIRDFLPGSMGDHLKFELCLRNKNRVFIGNKELVLDWQSNEIQEKVNIGAMSVYPSQIPDPKLYKKIGQWGCVPADVSKFSTSTIFTDINSGLVLDTNSREVSAPEVYVGETWVYSRMRWSSLFFVLIFWYLAWWGFVLLLNKIIGFVRGEN